MAAAANPRAARERKQKIFVAVGGLLLLALLAIQLPKMLGGPATEAAATTDTTVAGEETTVPGTPSAPVPTTLTDSVRRLTAGPGQLRSFTVFDRKDPFIQQLDTPDSAEDGGDGDGGEGGGGGGGGGGDAENPPPSEDFSTDDPAAPAVTVISVNGARQALVPGAVFPAADPVFVLIAENPRAKTVVVGIAGGSYASGARASRLKIGKPLILTNTTTGASYRLVLVAVGEGKAAEQPDEDADKP
jgi:hypothetical protein